MTDSSGEKESSENEVKILPHRTTRGRRVKDEEDDPEFWQEQVWQEDPEDEEWKENTEGLSELDEFDSDFFESESEEEEGDDNIDKELRKQEKKRKHFDYEKITRLRQKRLNNSSRVWSVLEEPQVGPKGKLITQEMLMEEARKHEQATQKQLTERLALEGQVTAAPEKAAKPAPPIGSTLETFFSWSSEKIIPSEELRKTPEQRETEKRRGRYERQLYIFSNVAKPRESSYPDMYFTLDTRQVELNRTKNPRKPHLRAKYMDPITLTPYNTIEEFNSIRDASRGEDYHSLVSSALSLVPQTQTLRSQQV